MGAEHRGKIKNSNILKRLIDHAEGLDPDMSQSEVTAAISLLDRVMPKMKSVDADGDSSIKMELKVTIGGD